MFQMHAAARVGMSQVVQGHKVDADMNYPHATRQGLAGMLAGVLEAAQLHQLGAIKIKACLVFRC